MNYELLRIKKQKNKACPAKRGRCGGYTIIETMIAISLFIVIVMYGMGALMSANVLHKKSQGMRSIIDNLSFITEDISRNLRAGSSYHCLVKGEVIDPFFTNQLTTPKSCAGGGWAIAFEPAKGNPTNFEDQWIYYISDDGKIFKAAGGPYEASNFVQLTPDNVVVNAAFSGFSVVGAESPTSLDFQQPFVVLRLVGTITYKEDIVTPFSIQTAVSQRAVDI